LVFTWKYFFDGAYLYAKEAVSQVHQREVKWRDDSSMSFSYLRHFAERESWSGFKFPIFPHQARRPGGDILLPSLDTEKRGRVILTL